MKVHLLAPDRDPEIRDDWLETRAELVRDLGVDALLSTMSGLSTTSGRSPFVHGVCVNVLLDSLTSPSEIEYRQQVLADWIQHEELLDELYNLAEYACDIKQRVRSFILGDHPSTLLNRAVALLRDLADSLRTLREFTGAHSGIFASSGLRTLISTVNEELDDAYLEEMRDHLRRLTFPTGVVMNAELDRFCRGSEYSLRRPASIRRSWRDLFGLLNRPGVYTYRLPDRDENGARTLARLRDYGLGQVATAAAQSADHVLDFFRRLRWELAFYVGAVRLHRTLVDRGAAVCMPAPYPATDRVLGAQNLTDVGLWLRGANTVVGNELAADDRTLIVVTGANEGGKSTFLRSLGLAQLMMQAGLFVTADEFRASVSSGVFTHYRREEDGGMTSGKLDEELQRMSRIVESVRPDGMILFNESFACTNEREGAQIARTILEALREGGVRAVFVTHLYALSGRLAADAGAADLFLRASRRDDGVRSYKVLPGAPEATSYGPDLYREIFDSQPA